MAVAILRVKKGLDYSRVLGDNIQTIFDDTRPLQPNDSSTDLLGSSNIHGSNESLSRNASQGLIQEFYFFFAIFYSKIFTFCAHNFITLINLTRASATLFSLEILLNSTY